MTFAWPHLLWLLIAPAALFAWELTHRRLTGSLTRPKILRAEAGVRSLKLTSFDAPSAPPGSAPRVWLCLGLACCIGALARPQWGRIEEPVFDQSREILLAIDLSRSMLAPDVRPSRLDRAKLLIQSLLEKLAGERVGLVVFSGTAFLQSPLSADYEILREFLPALGPDFLPEGGTQYGALIETALQAFGATTSADRFLVILSDGEATDENWRTRTDEKGAQISRIEELKAKGVRVIGLGVGTAGGAMIPDGTGQFVKDERGAVVLSKLESGTLQELAQATNGVYRDASAWVDLAALVSETVEAGRKGEFVEKNTVRLVERFQWPLAFGLWCLLVSFCYEFPVRPKPRDIRLAPETPEIKGQRSDVSRAIAAMLVLFLTAGAWPLPSAHAAATLAKPPATAAEPAPLAKIVSRLAGAATHSARDWAELGRETVMWGSRLQSEQHPVPEGPVRDALHAVDLGAKLDPKATDWKKLREDLEALLKKEDEEKKDEQDKPDQQENPDQDQEKQAQQGKKKQERDKSQQKKDARQENDPSDKTETSSGEPPDKKEEKKDPGESAFGDMSKKEEPPPPPPQEMQKVGGAPDNPQNQQETIDPSLALPLQKLEQLRNQDSPAQLFQLMEGERKQGPKKPAKDW